MRGLFRAVVTLCFLYCTTFTYAQIDISDFRLSGSATKISDQCIRLVPDFQYTSGSAWYKRPIDLNYPFEMEICLMLGEKDDDGADGIVFVFYPQIQNTGFWGEGMGFAGLRPSLGIEFDTYMNYHLDDPAEDHLAVMTNGYINHYFSGQIDPVLLGNVEDGGRHRLKIFWYPEDQNLEVYLDGDLQVSFQKDIINEVFQGNPTVFWGVTAATGRLSNNHEICLKKLIFSEAKMEKDDTATKGQDQK